MLQANHEGSHRAQEKEHKHCCQVLHADHFVVGGKAEVAPEALIFACQLEFFGVCGLAATKCPFNDPVEGANAYKEEEHPGGVDSRDHRVIVGDAVGAQCSRQPVHQHAGDRSCHDAEYYPGNHAWEKVVDEIWAPDRGYSCTIGCTAHKCPPWLVIQELNASALTTFTDSHI